MMLQRQVAVENGPHEVIPGVVVADILYSTEKKGLVEFLKNGGMENAQYMRSQTAEYWLNLLRETMCQCNNKPRVLLLSYPNANYNKELVANETARIEKQKEEMGPEGLEEAAEKVQKAIANTHLAPDELLMKMPFADTSTMAYRNLDYYNYTTADQPEGFDLK